MQEFIQSIAKQLGIDENLAQTIAGKLLALISSRLGSNATALLGRIPGAEQLAAAAAATGDGGGNEDGGGLLGSLTKAAASVVGGDAAQSLQLTTLFQEAGLDLTQATTFVSQFCEFVKQQVGEEAFAQIAEGVPEINALFGSQ